MVTQPVVASGSNCGRVLSIVQQPQKSTSTSYVVAPGSPGCGAGSPGIVHVQVSPSSVQGTELISFTGAPVEAARDSPSTPRIGVGRKKNAAISARGTTR